MGCVADKPIQPNQEANNAIVSRSSPYSSSPSPFVNKIHIINAKLVEAIKKRDIILLQKAMQKYNIKPTDFIGSSEQAKTLIHKLAEYNFSEGMTYLIEELSFQKPAFISRALNIKDIDGNTPLLLCCLSNSTETLEVLAKNEFVDMDAKNSAKKSALEIALEMESPCINILGSVGSGNAFPTKATLKSSYGEVGQQVGSIKNHFDKENDHHSEYVDTKTSIEGKSLTGFGSQRSLNNIKEPAKTSPLRINRGFKTLSELKEKGTNFVDAEFPHEIYYLEDEEMDGALLKKFPGLTWSRPCDVAGENVKCATIFNEFSINNVYKTPLAGCQIYSALAVMAEYPQRLSRVFNLKETNKHGIYSVTFTIGAVPIEVLLDDYFPTKNGSESLYSRPVGNELWFSLLEKAFAKLYGGYIGLESVGIMDALEIMTGMPVVQKSLKDVEEDKLWAKMIDYDKKNYILCAGEARRHHTFRNRVFNIVSIHDFKEHRLVKLKNHFGDFLWEGDFSKRSPLWTKELKETVGFDETDNCFFMSLTDFMKEFDILTVCYYYNSWVHNRLNTTCESNHPVYFELNVERETEAYISVHQKSPHFVDEGPYYDISPVEIIMAKDADGDNLEAIAFGERDAFLGKSVTYIHDNHKVKLQPGKYIIHAKVNWVDNQKHDFVLSLLSSNSLKINQIESSSCPNFLDRVYLGAGNASKDKFNLSNDCQFASGWAGSHLWMFAYNRTKKVWHLEVNFEKMTNLKLSKKYKGSDNTIKMVIQPNQSVAAYAKRTGPGPVAVAWHFNQCFE